MRGWIASTTLSLVPERIPACTQTVFHHRASLTHLREATSSNFCLAERKFPFFSADNMPHPVKLFLKLTRKQKLRHALMTRYLKHVVHLTSQIFCCTRLATFLCLKKKRMLAVSLFSATYPQLSEFARKPLCAALHPDRKSRAQQWIPSSAVAARTRTHLCTDIQPHTQRERAGTQVCCRGGPLSAGRKEARLLCGLQKKHKFWLVHMSRAKNHILQSRD